MTKHQASELKTCAHAIATALESLPKLSDKREKAAVTQAKSGLIAAASEVLNAMGKKPRVTS